MVVSFRTWSWPTVRQVSMQCWWRSGCRTRLEGSRNSNRCFERFGRRLAPKVCLTEAHTSTSKIGRCRISSVAEGCRVCTRCSSMTRRTGGRYHRSWNRVSIVTFAQVPVPNQMRRHVLSLGINTGTLHQSRVDSGAELSRWTLRVKTLEHSLENN